MELFKTLNTDEILQELAEYIATYLPAEFKGRLRLEWDPDGGVSVYILSEHDEEPSYN